MGLRRLTPVSCAAQALESPVSNFSATPRRLLLEWHAEAHLLPPWERAVEVRTHLFSHPSPCSLCAQVVSWLRRAAARRGCPVSLVTLLRHPVDIYPSWWRYEGLRMTRGQGLLQWVADNPNIQSTTLMAGVSRPAALPFATQMHEGRFDRLSLWDPRDAAALRLLLAAFDVIAPMERFEEAFFLLAERLGFQQLGFIRQNEGAKRDMWSLYRGNLSAVDEARMEGYGDGWAPHRDAPLVEAVNQSAAVDLRVYAHCVAAFERQIGALSSEAAARLRAFLDTPLEGQWKGERPQQIFEWRMARVALPGARRTLPRAVRNVSSDQLAVWSLVPIAAHEIHVDD